VVRTKILDLKLYCNHLESNFWDCMNIATVSKPVPFRFTRFLYIDPGIFAVSSCLDSSYESNAIYSIEWTICCS
jgi:hypothetical protein